MDLPLVFAVKIYIKDNCGIDLFRYTKKDKAKYKRNAHLKSDGYKRANNHFMFTY
ncbi:hypothetical protein K151_1173 [Proteus hauseri ZMd44]|nr:hypothetical protein K151_1173 [Proteus hauseri ZMd44]